MSPGEAPDSVLGARLLEARGSRTLREIERQSGINTGYLSQLERGKIAHPSPSVLRRIADAYGVRYEDALSWAGYTEAVSDARAADTNLSVALKTVENLGSLQDEELETLQSIVNLLRSKRRDA